MDYFEKLKQIRAKLHLTQEDLARKLEVTLLTVNRWESGVCKPSHLAQRVIDNFCKENNIKIL